MRPFRLKQSEPTEAAVLAAVLRCLQLHPQVGRVWRQNTGAGKLVRTSGASQFIRFGFKGAPDVAGYMRDGRALYVEVKRPSGLVSVEQQAFIEDAARHGCVAFVARSITDVYKRIGC